jgi:hypothetical protein
LKWFLKPKGVRAGVAPLLINRRTESLGFNERLRGLASYLWLKTHATYAFRLLIAGAFTQICAPNFHAYALAPGEGENGVVFTLTHLHPAAYLILFFILVLSVLNLVVQGWISVDRFSISALKRYLRRSSIIKRFGVGNVHGASPGGGPSQREEGIIVVKRSLNTDGKVTRPRIITPLDGVNHPMPNFGASVGAQTGAPRILNSMPKRNSAADFKFSSAVDIPSPEEMERRGKEQMVVSGSVKGPDGSGIASVIVYLTDEEGNRLGQSCRSMPETGEFKVLINDPGKYILNGYKRGYIMEDGEPLIVPIESGRIEGFNIRMIPEGCIVHGKVTLDEEGIPAPNVTVRCICGINKFTREAITDSSGEFKIQGALVNSKCHIEIVDADQRILALSDAFETVQKKEIVKNISIAGQTETSRAHKPTNLRSGSVVAVRRDESMPDNPAAGGFEMKQTADAGD